MCCYTSHGGYLNVDILETCLVLFKADLDWAFLHSCQLSNRIIIIVLHKRNKFSTTVLFNDLVSKIFGTQSLRRWIYSKPCWVIRVWDLSLDILLDIYMWRFFHSGFSFVNDFFTTDFKFSFNNVTRYILWKCTWDSEIESMLLSCCFGSICKISQLFVHEVMQVNISVLFRFNEISVLSNYVNFTVCWITLRIFEYFLEMSWYKYWTLRKIL